MFRSKKDSDHDFLTDYQESEIFGTDPKNPDTDNDGIPDGIEVMIGTNPKGVGFLHDLFIPGAHNDYKPKVLQPKRLVYHALSAIIIKVVMVVFLLSFPIEAWLSPTVLTETSNQIISLTNDLRQSLGVNTLTKNNLLETAAINKAQDMLVQQYFAHVGPDNRSLKNWLVDVGYDYRMAGENLALGFSSATDVMAAWQNSPTHYANLIDPDFTQIGVGAVSGNYQSYDSVLIAQYFGNPRQAETTPVIEEKPTEIIELPLSPAPEVVLAQKEEEPLPNPVLLLPQDNFLTKDNNIVLSVSAPLAQKVLVYVDDTVLINRTLDEDMKVEIPMIIEEGQHTLYLKSLRGSEEAMSRVYTLTIDNSIPLIDQSRTKLSAIKDIDDIGVTIFAETYLESDTQKSDIMFGQYVLNLEPDDLATGKWVGSLIMADKKYEDLFSPVTLASIRVEDKAGNVVVQDIAWSDIQPVEVTPLEQYSFLKNNQSDFIRPIFDFTSVYYKVILSLAILASLLNIFIYIRKQHKQVVLSSFGFIALLYFLMII